MIPNRSSPAALAYHSRNSLSPSSDGEEVDRALDYLGRAGRRSLGPLFARREAIGFLSDALVIASGENKLGDLAGSSPARRSPTGCGHVGSRTWPRPTSAWGG